MTPLTPRTAITPDRIGIMVVFCDKAGNPVRRRLLRLAAYFTRR